jgi:putative salt-induced outer membrane protein
MMKTSCAKALCALALGLTVCGQAADTVTNVVSVKPKWETTLGIGATVTRGNSQTLAINGQIGTVKKWDKNEIDLGADGNYSSDKGVTSSDQAHGYGQYNRLFTERWYAYARADALYDGVADIDYRITLSPGAGYYFIKSAQTNLKGEVGPGWVYEKDSGQSGRDYFTLRLAENFDYKITAASKFYEKAEYLPAVDNWGQYIINAEIGIETAIIKGFGTKIYMQDSYNSRPAQGRDNNDFKLVAAVTYKF